MPPAPVANMIRHYQWHMVIPSAMILAISDNCVISGVVHHSSRGRFDDAGFYIRHSREHSPSPVQHKASGQMLLASHSATDGTVSWWAKTRVDTVKIWACGTIVGVHIERVLRSCWKKTS